MSSVGGHSDSTQQLRQVQRIQVRKPFVNWSPLATAGRMNVQLSITAFRPVVRDVEELYNLHSIRIRIVAFGDEVTVCDRPMFDSHCMHTRVSCFIERQLVRQKYTQIAWYSSHISCSCCVGSRMAVTHVSRHMHLCVMVVSDRINHSTEGCSNAKQKELLYKCIVFKYYISLQVLSAPSSLLIPCI